MKKLFSLLFFCALLFNVSGQGKFTDPRDGNVYKTVSVDKFTWMDENLRYKPQDKTYYFDNDPNNRQIYGVLYDWKTAMNVCPDGWRLPTGTEFQTIVDQLDEKENGNSNSNHSDTPSFKNQLGGMQDFEGTFTELDESAYFWTSTEYDKENAEYFSYVMVVKMPVADVSRKDDISDIHGAEKTNKYSVRCIKK